MVLSVSASVPLLNMPLDVHLGQRLLHVLDVLAGIRQQHLPLPQVAAQHTHRLGGPEGAGQQAIGVQALQPLGVVGIALGPATMNLGGNWQITADGELVQDSLILDGSLVFGDFSWTDHDLARAVKPVMRNKEVNLLVRVTHRRGAGG